MKKYKLTKEDKEWLDIAQKTLPNVLVNGKEAINHKRRLRKAFERDGGQGVAAYIEKFKPDNEQQF